MAGRTNPSPEPNLQVQFGKKYRQLNGYTQAKLAELCGLSDNYIVEIEIGRKFPTAKVIAQIAAALSLEPFQLFKAEDATGICRTVIIEERIHRAIQEIFKDSQA